MPFEVLLLEPDNSQKPIMIENLKLRIENSKTGLQISRETRVYWKFQANPVSFFLFFLYVVAGINDSY